MARTVSATMAKSNFGALVESVSHGEGQIVVENRGEPVAAIISIAALREFESLRTDERRRTILAKLRALQARTRAKNPDLSEQEVSVLAKRVVADAVDALVEQNLIRFEQ